MNNQTIQLEAQIQILEKMKSSINSLKIKDKDESIWRKYDEKTEVVDSINEGLKLAIIAIDCEIEKLKYKMQQKQRELEGESNAE